MDYCLQTHKMLHNASILHCHLKIEGSMDCLILFKKSSRKKRALKVKTVIDLKHLDYKF